MELCDAAGVNCENEALYGGTCSEHVGLPLRKVRTEADSLRAQLKLAVEALEEIANSTMEATVGCLAEDALRAIKGEGGGKT